MVAWIGRYSSRVSPPRPNLHGNPTGEQWLLLLRHSITSRPCPKWVEAAQDVLLVWGHLSSQTCQESSLQIRAASGKAVLDVSSCLCFAN